MKKSFEPKLIESYWYNQWEEKGYFNAKPNSKLKPYTIMIPPPNVTGTLHMGHGFQNTLIDVLIRYKRMSGYDALWQVGTDHAGIATQMVVERQLEEKGKSKEDIGREKFEKKVWEWKDKSGNKITRQLRRLGASVDWSRETFTMDPKMSEAVKEVFIKLYEEGLIYRGKRLVNWDIDLQTALSDLEVTHTEESGFLWFFQYPVLNGDKLVIATTRPETMLGDTAVAVNPKDKRYKKFIGKKILLPICNREIPIISDDHVDSEFGSGCVKITPGHDFNDFEIGERHKLPVINILNLDGTLNNQVPKEFQGLQIKEARKKIINNMSSLGLLEKELPHITLIPRGDRSNAVLEPLITDQWFVDVKEMAKEATRMVKTDKIKFVPKRWEKTYFSWMNNIQDWCISRQLWWGHRIPAWFCNKCEHITVSMETPIDCEECKSRDIFQDPDVLDTWFSSGLWTHSTLGWPNDTKDLNKFYPSTVMETGYDILFFWVARMIMLGIENMGKSPFSHIYLHGLILDPSGLKMSKSKGNVMNPLELIDEYGADALRFAITTGITPGNNQRIDERKIESGRNFANKIWNASRFVISNISKNKKDIKEISTYDIWILTKLHETTIKVNENLANFQFGEAQRILYEFFWNEFCDWYIEFYKHENNGENKSIQSAPKILIYILKESLKLLHPFMPFMTEKIWQILNEELANINTGNDKYYKIEKLLINAKYPIPETLNKQWKSKTKDIDEIIKSIKALRNIRSELGIEHNRLIQVNIQGTDEETNKILNHSAIFLNLAKAELKQDIPVSHGQYIPIAIGNQIVNIEIPEGLNLDAEIKRIKIEIKEIEIRITPLEKRIKSPNFFNNAPEEIILKEKDRLEEQNNRMSQLKEILKSIS